MNAKNKKGIEGMMELLDGDDLDFYETFLMELSEEEEKRFFEENPEFLEEYSVDEERRGLLKEKMYRDILRKTRQK